MSGEITPLFSSVNGSAVSELTQKIYYATLSGKKPPSPKTIEAAKAIFKAIGITCCFASLYPAAKLAAEDGYEYSYAVIANFGSFGAWGYNELANQMFASHSPSRQKKVSHFITCVAAILFGFSSRLPSAGVALNLTPDMRMGQREVWAVIGIVGTAGPECLSMFKTLHAMSDRLSVCCIGEEEYELRLIKQTLVKCIEGAKIHGLQLSLSDRSAEFSSLEDTIYTSTVHRVQDLFKEVIKGSYLLMAEGSTSCCHKIGTWICTPIGIVATTGLLALNSILSQDAVADFTSNEYISWPTGILAALTFAYTGYQVVPTAACRIWDRVTDMFSCRNNTTYSEIYYPKTSFLCEALALVNAGLIWGLVEEETDGSSGNTWYRETYQDAVFTALFLLIYNSWKDLFIDPGIEYFASKFGNNEAKKALEFFHKMQIIKQTVVAATLPQLCLCLNEIKLDGNQLEDLSSSSKLTPNELSTLLSKLSRHNN